MTDNILVIKLSALGDFILALGAMEAIRKHHPTARITLLTMPAFADFASRSRYFDAVEVDRRPAFHDLAGWFRLARFFNKGLFGRVYDLQMNDRTKMYRRLFLKKPEWSGVVPGSRLFYPDPAWRQMHAFDRHRAVLAVAGIDLALPSCLWMDADIGHFGLRKPFVLLVPGSAPQHPAKRWPVVKYIGLAQRLTREGYRVAVLGTQAESDITAKIARASPEVIDLTGQTSLFEIAALARRAAGAVGNDTGPMHLIALAGCPALTLFSSASDPALSAPRGPQVRVLACDDLGLLSVDEVMKNLTLRRNHGANSQKA